MSTTNAKLIFDIGNDSAVALKVEKKLLLLAEELHLVDYLTRSDYVRKTKPLVPTTATADATRKYDLEMVDFKMEVENLRKLREAAEGYLSTAAYEQLCVRLGRSSSDCLSAKELIDGIKKHYAKLTTAQAEDIINELQVAWNADTSISAHIIKHATRFADLKAGERALTDQASKATLWRSLTALKKNPVYTSLNATMRIPVEDESITMPEYVAMFLKELLEEQYADLNADKTKATGETEVVLAVKEKETREQKFREKQKANKAKYASHPVEAQCPVHPDNEHTWGTCSHFLGKKWKAPKKDK